MTRPFRIPDMEPSPARHALNELADEAPTESPDQGAWTIHHIASAPTDEAFYARCKQAMRAGAAPTLIADAISAYTKEHPE